MSRDPRSEAISDRSEVEAPNRKARPRRPRRSRNTTPLLPQLLSAAVEMDPGRDAVIFGDRSLSYAELDRQSSQIARLLIERGAGPEVVFAIAITRSIDSVLALWAVAKSGAAFVPVDPTYPADRIQHMLSDSGALMGVTTAEFVGRLPDDCRWSVLDDPDFAASAAAMSDERISLSDRSGPLRVDNPAYIIYTSGSTGLPKGVVVTHSGLAALANEQVARFGTSSGSRTLHFASPSFDMSVFELLLAVYSGATMVITPTDIIGGSDLADLIRRERVTHAFATPAALSTVSDADLPLLEVVVVAGEACPPELVESWGRSTQFFNAYGPTETSMISTISPALGPGEPVTIGDAIPGTSAYVLDRRFRAVPTGASGELYISGAGVARGYLSKPGLTSARFVANPLADDQTRMYRTGDLVRRTPAGALIFIGRNDAQVKVRGFRIELGEIDATLAAHPSVGFAVTVARGGPDGEKVLAAYVRPASGHELDPADLAAFARRSLPKHMIPSSIMVIDEIPMTPVGKLDRARLPDPVFTAREYRAPETDAEIAVAAVFEEILGSDRAGKDDDFFELGGNSLSATRLAARIGAALDISFGAREVFEDSTVTGLAAAAERKIGGPSRIALGADPRPSRIPLSLAQQRMWFLNRFDPESAAYNIPVAIRLTGEVDVAALRAAIDDVSIRHEPLRTIYPSDSDGPYQRILPTTESIGVQIVEISADRIVGAVQELAASSFDVSSEVPVRVRLYRLSDSEFVLALVVQHISADGGSIGPLTRDLMLAYAARTQGEVPGWVPLEVQYADYALWQRRVLGSEDDPASVSYEQLEFWKSELAGLPDQIDLPTDRPRPAVQSFAGGRIDFVIDAGVQASLTALARGMNATLFMAVHAGWAALLSRLSGSMDIAVGSPIAGRGEEALDDLIGMFANTLVFRTVVEPASSFEQLLADVRETDIRALAHADVPFERLVEVLNPARSTARHPLFQVGLSFQNLENAEFELPGLTVSGVEADAEVAQFDLHLIVSDQYDEHGNPTGIGATLKFATALFDESSAVAIADRFVAFLGAVAEDPSRVVGDVEMLGVAERDSVVRSWNGTDRVVDGDATLVSLLYSSVAAVPGSVALSFGADSWTYGEFADRVNRLARHLVSLGVGPESRVAVAIRRSESMVAAMYAAVVAGAAYVPVDPDQPADRIGYILDSARPVVVLVSRRDDDLDLSDVGAVVVDVESVDVSELSGAPLVDTERLGALCPDNAAYVIFTSGSTGRPKGVAISHRAVVNQLEWKRSEYELDCSDVFLLKTAATFDLSVWELWSWASVGGRLVVSIADGHRDPAYLVDLIERESVTTLHVVPSMLGAINAASGGSLPSCVRRVLAIGETLPAALVESVLSGSDVRLDNVYGPTEAAVSVTSNRIELPVGSVVPVGRPEWNVSVFVLDGRLHPVPVGVVGELYLAGVQLARGYHGRADLTSERFVADPFGSGERLYRTGDVVRWNRTGVLDYVGRSDFQVKVRGFRIELGEIESVLGGIDGVRDAVVVANSNDRVGDRLVAYLVSGGGVLDVDSVKGVLGERLPSYMVPSAFVVLDALPLTVNGKLDRKALPEPEFEVRVFRAPSTSVEESVAGVFADVLGVERVGLDDDFFELGGNSLVATQVVARLGAALDMQVPVRVLFEASSVFALAARVESQVGSGARVALTARSRPERVPLSLAQQRMWFLNRFDSQSAAYNIPVAIRLSGVLDVVALEAAVGDVVARHESLRTVYPEVDGVPVQRILSVADAGVGVVSSDVGAGDIVSVVGDLASSSFDVTSEVPVRVRLYRVADSGSDSVSEFVLALVVHHISGDRSSMGPLTRDLMLAYAARTQGEVPGWVPLEVQYADYALWQRQVLGSVSDPASVSYRQLEFWKSELAGLPDQIDLPTDRPRPAVQSFAGGRVDFAVDAAVQKSLMDVARGSNATLFMAVHAGWAALLSRLSGSSDVAVGSPIAGRGEEALDDLIGMFANTLVFRTEVDPAASYVELLQSVRERDLQAFAHADVPFEQLVEVLNPARSTARHPLFQVGLSFQNVQSTVLELPSLSVSGVDADLHTSQFDLHLIVSDQYDEHGSPAGVGMSLTYATALFDESSAVAIADRFVAFLGAVAEDPSRVVGDVEMLGVAERDSVVRSWNGTDRVVDGDATLVSLLYSSVAAVPGSVALSFGADSWTYGEFADRVNRLARHLVSLGVGPESRVAVAIRRSESMVAAMYAAVVAGAAYVPVDPDQPADRIGYILDSARPVVVLVSRRDDDLDLSDVGAVVVDVESVDVSELSGAPLVDTERLGALCPDNAAYVIFTSGSTGRPKGVAISHRAVVNQLEWKRSEYELDCSDVFLLKTAATFDLSVWELWSWASVGGRLVVSIADGHRDPAYLVDLIERESVTTLHVVPSMLGAINAASGGSLPSCVRRVLAIGETLPAALVESVLSGSDVRLDNVYGPTEAAVSVTSNRIELPVGSVVPVGRPEWNVSVFVLDGRLHPVPVGVVGELYLAGVQLARGYHGRADLTSERFVADPFGSGERLYRTGDVVRWNRTGVLDYVGRSDFQVKVRGFRIELGEIESVLGGIDGVRDAVVVANSNDRVGDRLVAYLVSGGGVLDVDSVKGVLGERLPSYMVPSAFVVLDALPLTVNGKLDRKALPEPEFEVRVFRAPSTSVEESVAGVFADVLGVERVGLDDDFFELGGNSLVATQVVARLGAALDMQVPVRVLFEASSVFALAARVESQVGSGARVALTARSRPERVPLSLAQQRMWFLNRFDSQSAAYNIPVAIRLSGVLDVVALEAAVGDVVARHESLRTVYPEVDGVPVQRILSVADAGVGVVSSDVGAGDIVSVVGDLASSSFDVTSEVPVRVRLYRVADSGSDSVSEFVLALVVHHISGDRSSMGPLTRDLMLAYAARTQGEVPGWVPLEVQYADYALWQRQVLGSVSDPASVSYRQLEFWKSELAGLPDQIDLPTDRPRPAVQSFAGGRVDFAVDAAVQKSLMDVARGSNATLFMAVHAGWAALLSRLSGSSDVAVGSPIAGRGEEALDDLIGMFANTLVFRTEVDPAASYVELLQSVRERDLQAFAHADVPFEQLVEVLNPARSTARHPLFQVGLSFQNVQSTVLELPSLSVSGVDADLHTSQFDLHLIVSDQYDEHGSPAGVGMSLTYATALFDESSAVAIADRFVAFLGAVAEDPQLPVGDYPILGAAELAEVSASSAVVVHPVSGRLLLDAYTDRVSVAADSTAIVFEGTELSYGGFDRRVNALARYLISRGVGPEVVVGLALRRSLDLVVAMYAVVRAGGAYLALDPDHPSDRIAYILDTAGPLCVLCASDGVAVDFGGALVDLRTLDLAGFDDRPVAVEELRAPVRPSNTAYVLFTSGSTGRPKGVAVSHGAIENQMEWMTSRYELVAEDVYLQKTATTFDVSLWGFFLPLRVGATLVLASADGRRDPEYLSELIAEHQVTLTDFVPSMLTVFAALARAERLVSLRDVFVIGEALPLETVRDFRGVSGARLHNLYGPTEAAVSVTSWEAGVGERGSVPIGVAEWNVGTSVLDSRLHPVADGVPGELYLTGAQLARGYVSRADLTAGRFVAAVSESGASMYRTGDLVRRRKDGVLEYIGRTDFQVKFRGQRIELGEIESALLGHEGVLQAVAAVVGSATGDRLAAYVVPTPGEVLIGADVLGHVSDVLPSYMVPSACVVLDALPLNPAGKLDRKALPEPEFEVRVFRAPSTSVEESVAGVFADVLGVERVGLDDDFFELGGNSLVAMQVVARLGAALDSQVPLMSLFSNPSVEALAKSISEQDVEEDGTYNVLDVVWPVRSSGSSERLWCVHPMAGLSWVFADLATDLDPQVAITTLQSPALTEHDWRPASIDAWASRYVREIKRVQPQGPYMLLGWSLGGVLAHAIAVLLQDAGDDVPVLAMMDSTLDASAGDDPESAANNVAVALSDLFGGMMPDTFEQGVPISYDAIADVLATMPDPFSAITSERLEGLVEGSTDSSRLICEYEPQVYAGDLVYFTAIRDHSLDDSPAWAWQPHVSGRIANSSVDSTHGAMTTPESLASIAAVLNTVFRRHRA